MEIDAVMWYMGVNKTNAKRLVRELPKERMQLIVKCFKDNARRCAYED